MYWDEELVGGVLFPERDDGNRAYSQARAAIAKATA
jgi:hypothetical protein